MFPLHFSLAGPKYDNAVTTYGIQLRAWVDMQVQDGNVTAPLTVVLLGVFFFDRWMLAWVSCFRVSWKEFVLYFWPAPT